LLLPDLNRYIRKHPVKKRTPRVPVIDPSDINATDNSTPQIKNIVSSSKNANDDVNDDATIFAMDGSSPDGSSGITEANKVAEGQTFLEIKGTSDMEISQTQQHLKKRIQESMDEAQTSKVELGTTTVAEEGNNLDDYQRLSQLFSPGIFEPIGCFLSLAANIGPPSGIRNHVCRPLENYCPNNQRGMRWARKCSLNEKPVHNV
jgi:hypothetical protein